MEMSRRIDFNFKNYNCFVFDCDGVVLNSNSCKTEAFRAAALPWGEAAAEELVAHHVANGGVSRYEKFRHLIEEILPRVAPQSIPGRDGPDFESMLETYAEAAREGLLTCAIADGLQELRVAAPQQRWMIISGGDQTELRAIFEQRGLAKLFDGGIFGSPDPKKSILEREIKLGTIRRPALFLGDSRLDHEAASEHDLDFLFVSKWTDFAGWEDYFASRHVDVIPTISTLLTTSPGHRGRI
ncbi:HAD family hydrolase [Wenzhouxiangella sp. EGI_FJ10305]|uniref:HAD family hydrolase n=1 Tax=Wenzhouxiangella sp. EGI_FJ10305 TaxID=3243768 RepID=UPI0035DBE232